MASNKKQPQTLVHFTSRPDGTKSLETEIVKPGSASAVFLQRMEKHQQNKPCFKSIDLREKMSNEIFEYEYQDIIHYLDAASIELFENLVAKSQYVYTLHVHDRVIAAANSIKPPRNKKPPPQQKKQKPESQSVEQMLSQISAKEQQVITNTAKSTTVAKQNKQQRQKRQISGTPIKIAPFGYHRHQNEVRMLYMSNLQIYTEIDQKWTDAKTINLSVSGLKIKMEQNCELYEGQKLSVHFTDLNEKLGKPYPSINYEVVNIDFQQENQVVRLIRLENEEDSEFVSALSKFISINRRRYKIDLDDFIASVESKYLERIYSLNSQLPSLFFHNINGQIKLKHMLTNSFFKAEKRLLQVLSEIKSGFEIFANILNTQNDSVEKKSLPLLNIYCFEELNKNGEQTLYSALETDFEDQAEKSQFLKKAIVSNNYHGWTILISPCNLLSEAATSSFISENEDISIEESKQLTKELETVIATGKLVNNKQLVLLQSAQYPPITNQQYFNLEKFICEPVNKQTLTNVKVAQKKQRNENRYFLTTSVEVEVNGKMYTGHTLDFSPNGVKLQLDTSLQAEHRESADISFPGLQNKFKKEKLTQQHFRIANISRNGKTICFSRDRRFVLHEASIFFRQLIDCNLHKLTQCSGDTFMVVRSAMLEHILTRNLLTIPFYVSLKNHLLKTTKIAANENPIPLLWEFKSAAGYNFDSIFNSHLWNKIMLACTKNNKIEVIYETEIYLYKNDKFENWQASIAEDYKSINAQNNFIQQLSKSAYKKVLHLTLTPTPLFDDKYIIDELHEIRNNSRNQSDSLQNDLKAIRALGELVEVTGNYFSR